MVFLRVSYGLPIYGFPMVVSMVFHWFQPWFPSEPATAWVNSTGSAENRSRDLLPDALPAADRGEQPPGHRLDLRRRYNKGKAH